MAFNECQGSREEALSEPREINRALADLSGGRVALVERQGPHIVAVGQAEVGIETVGGGRPMGGDVPQVPLADQSGGIVGLQCARQSKDAGRKADRVAGLDDLMGQAMANCVAAGEQAGPRGRADIGRSVEVRQSHPLGGHFVEAGGLDDPAAIAAQIPVAEVIGKDHDEIWGAAGGTRDLHGGAAPVRAPASPVPRLAHPYSR